MYYKVLTFVSDSEEVISDHFLAMPRLAVGIFESPSVS